MAETDMVERVARAIARTQSGSLFREECTAVQLDAFGYIAAARAAIEAMREPTEEMLFAADWMESGTREAYGNMIDAALSLPSKD